MNKVDNELGAKVSSWQSNFVTLLPEIEQRLRHAFRLLDAEARDDAVAEATVHCLLNYSRLYDRRGAEAATASTLAWYAAKQVRRGRPACNRMNSKEPLSRYGQLSNAIGLEQQHGNWMDLVVADTRASVPDRVAAKLDVGAWFGTLSHRMKQIAQDLAYGFSTSEVAEKHGVTPGRISQLRRSLEASWSAFQHQAVLVQ